MIGFDLNNNRRGYLTQAKHDDKVVYTIFQGSKEDRIHIIPVGEFVMLMNLYRYIKDNDIKNDFINPYGKNKED